jgi:hypothetical protein
MLTAGKYGDHKSCGAPEFTRITGTYIIVSDFVKFEDCGVAGFLDGPDNNNLASLRAVS